MPTAAPAMGGHRHVVRSRRSYGHCQAGLGCIVGWAGGGCASGSWSLTFKQGHGLCACTRGDWGRWQGRVEFSNPPPPGPPGRGAGSSGEGGSRLRGRASLPLSASPAMPGPCLRLCLAPLSAWHMPLLSGLLSPPAQGHAWKPGWVASRGDGGGRCTSQSPGAGPGMGGGGAVLGWISWAEAADFD